MITLTREEAQQVLDVIEKNIVGVPRRQANDLLRDRLAQPEPAPTNNGRYLTGYKAQPEPEPVADKYLMEVECTKCGAKQDGILTVNAPQQRNWQRLTDEEVMSLLPGAVRLPPGWVDTVRAIEAKLKEKNG
jgi:hypothetical protein